MSKALTKIDTLKGILRADSVQEQFKNALKENSSLFVASIIDLYNGDKSLQDCEPKAVVMEALKAAVLKLPINKALGFSYIIVFNSNKKNEQGVWTQIKTPTFVIGYKGYIQLAMRTGQYRTINADVVYDGELKHVNKLSGEIAINSEQKVSDKVVGYFCYFELLNGFSKTLYMSVRQMAAYAKRYSPSLRGSNVSIETLMLLANGEASGSVGWEGNFNDMALKTVIRRLLAKYGYLSVDMQEAIASDEIAEETEAVEIEEIDVQSTNVVEDEQTSDAPY